MFSCNCIKRTVQLIFIFVQEIKRRIMKNKINHIDHSKDTQQNLEAQDNRAMTSQNNSKSQKNAKRITDKSSGKGYSGSSKK